MKVVAIIQARLGASRLPGKVLLDIAGKSAIERVLERARRIPGVDEVVVAVPNGKADLPLREALEASGAKVFTGSEKDVLERYYKAAKATRADIVLRVTADCPLLDPEVSGKVLKALLDSGADYASNIAPATFPDGLDTEAFRFQALQIAWRSACRPAEREHVTVYLRQHPERFRQANVAGGRDLSRQRWTLDEPADLAFLRALCAELDGRSTTAGHEEIMKVLERKPEIARLNADILANEGYYKSLLKERPLPAKKIRLKRSLELLDKARALVPGASQTFSKAPSQFVRGVAPLFLAKAKGCQVEDADGNRFIDTMMALGAISLGYADPDVNAAAARQLKEGTTFSQPHPLEAEVAGLIKELVPCAEMARFAKNGSDTTTAAVRLARYATGRDLIAACGYHGWHDWYIATTTRSGGVPEAVKALTKTFTYNKIDTLERLFAANPGRIAAVILEPIGVEEPQPGFLQAVAGLTRKNGAIFIFDEMVTGFRMALGGAQAHYGVTPDLACFGKAVANGFPLAALVGRAELMKKVDEIFFSGTFGGETLSLAAAKATILKMRAKQTIPHVWHIGRKLQDGFNTLARETGLDRYARCIGLPPHTVMPFKTENGEDWWELKSLFQQECVRRGFLFIGAHNPCYAHKEADADQVLRVYASAMPIVAEAARTGTVGALLEGPPVEAIFRKP
jgi:glutamate-1-semialdehyde 2,1-aminomutase/spore coat polysaccharide biosynthesis protein SpsF